MTVWILSLSNLYCSVPVIHTVICVDNVLTQCKHEMFFLSCRVWHTSSRYIWNNIRCSLISSGIFRDCLRCWLTNLLLFWNRVEIKHHCLLLHHLILSDLSETSFFRRCTISSAVTLNLMFFIWLRTLYIPVLLGITSSKATSKELSTKHRLINWIRPVSKPMELLTLDIRWTYLLL